MGGAPALEGGDRVRRLTRPLTILCGVAALAGAVVLALVAVDARAWGDTMRNDDALFRVAPGRAQWAPSQHAPFHVTERLLGVRDDVMLRRAIAQFQVARLLQATTIFTLPEVQAATARAEIALVGVERSGAPDRDKSIAANLLGVITFRLAFGSQSSTGAAIARSMLAFRRAILWDGSNEDAKSNLELALRLEQAVRVVQRQQQGVLGSRQGHGQGSGRGGRGY
jgi:hypothetical protein